VIIRPANEADIPVLAALTAASYRAGFSGVLEEEALAARNAGFFFEAYQTRWPMMRVAGDGPSILGLSLLEGDYLVMLFVSPDAIGKGVGAALLRDVEARGGRTLECFRDNHAARRFYERAGWRIAREYEREFIGRPRAFVWFEKPL
jgi:putative acetyltransferase